MSQSPDLSAEVALVTGGSRNIGLAIARTLRAAGARVCIWGASDPAALARRWTQSTVARTSVAACWCASTTSPPSSTASRRSAPGWDRCPSWSTTPRYAPTNPWRRRRAPPGQSVLDVTLTGAFLTSRELFRRLPQDRNGAIVNIGGLSAHRPKRGRVHVITAKAGLIGLTRALAEEGLGRIRANCVVPGAIDTVRPDGRRPPHLDDAGHAAGSPAAVARTVLALADPGEPYVTGQTLHVSGGRFMP